MAAQALMEVVPKGTPMEVKVEAFNFHKFGTIKGKVREISQDAIEDKEGHIFRVMVSLDEEKLHLDNKVLQVAPGMAVSAEIKIRKKRIIDLLTFSWSLSKLIRMKHYEIDK